MVEKDVEVTPYKVETPKPKPEPKKETPNLHERPINESSADVDGGDLDRS